MTEQAAPQETERKHSNDDSCCGGSGKKAASARDVLDRRFAGGEITRELYMQMKSDLGLTEAKTENKKGCC